MNGENFPAACQFPGAPVPKQENICTGPYIDALFGTSGWEAASRTYTYGGGGSWSRKLEMYIATANAGFTPVSYAYLEFGINLQQKLLIIRSSLRWEFIGGFFSATVYYRRTKTRLWAGQFSMGPCVFRENAFCDGVPRLASLLPGSVSVDVQDGNATASVNGASVDLTLYENTDQETGTGSGFDYWGGRYPMLACQKQAAESFSLNATVSYDPQCPGSSAP